MSKTYSASYYQHIDRAEREHFWFVARNDMIISMIRRIVPDRAGKPFLDIGCGTGVLLRRLRETGFIPTGLDVNARALSYAASHTHGTLVRSSIGSYAPKKPFAAAGAFDVIEHISDDAGVIARCHRLLERGGYIFLTVPAEPYLWSSIDTLSGHKRRYTKAGLQTLLERNGFRVLSIGYWNSLLLPVYMLWRLAKGKSRDGVIQQYLTTPHPMINAILLYVLRMETVLFRGKLPFGASLVVAAQKV